MKPNQMCSVRAAAKFDASRCVITHPPVASTQVPPPANIQRASMAAGVVLYPPGLHLALASVSSNPSQSVRATYLHSSLTLF